MGSYKAASSEDGGRMGYQDVKGSNSKQASVMNQCECMHKGALAQWRAEATHEQCYGGQRQVSHPTGGHIALHDPVPEVEQLLLLPEVRHRHVAVPRQCVPLPLCALGVLYPTLPLLCDPLQPAPRRGRDFRFPGVTAQRCH